MDFAQPLPDPPSLMGITTPGSTIKLPSPAHCVLVSGRRISPFAEHEKMPTPGMKECRALRWVEHQQGRSDIELMFEHVGEEPFVLNLAGESLLRGLPGRACFVGCRWAQCTFKPGSFLTRAGRAAHGELTSQAAHKDNMSGSSSKTTCRGAPIPFENYK
ncbi:hypothetical protein Droror1_Dr00011604 [Drosera rotundifolia]